VREWVVVVVVVVGKKGEGSMYATGRLVGEEVMAAWKAWC